MMLDGARSGVVLRARCAGCLTHRMIHHRWLQLGAGIAALVAVANLQYGWTLFVDPIDEAHHWKTWNDGHPPSVTPKPV